jgi:AraC-like DNA-binding protein
VPVPIAWQGDMELVQLMFNLRGNSSFEQTVFGNLYFSPLQQTAFYSQGFKGILHAEKGAHRTLVIQFEKQAFLNLIEDTTEQFRRMGVAIAQGKPIMIAPYHLHIDLTLQQAISEIIHCRYAGKMKKIFLYAKTLEILVLQAEAYESYAQKKVRYCQSKADKEKIVFAREYLIQHLQQPPTIPELAKIAGLNEFKLKKGFRELFNQSVFGYLTDYRMEMAKILLLESQKTVSELAFELGYSSPQHFSMAFKKKFGLAPRHLKKR